MSEPVRPMLAAAGALPVGGDWAFEFKYDGVRAITYVEGGGVRVLSRNGNDITTHYPELGELIGSDSDSDSDGTGRGGGGSGGRDLIVDGEIVALGPGDRPSFSLLQNRMHVAAPPAALLRSVPVRYYVFDVLRIGRESLLDLPYLERRERLRDLDLVGDHVRVPTSFTEAHGQAVLRTAELAGFEGVVAKRLNGPYRAGRRSADWTKVALVRTQEVLIVGFEVGKGRRSGTVGALLLGVRDEQEQIVYAGQVGTGFTDAMLQHLQDELAVRRRATSPAIGVPREHARQAHWVEPDLVGEVAFRNWTPDGRLRHASWRGLRPDQPERAARRPAASPPVITGALATADGAWRVEVIRRDGHQSYRILHAGNVVEGLTLADVERALRLAGVGLADLEAAA